MIETTKHQLPIWLSKTYWSLERIILVCSLIIPTSLVCVIYFAPHLIGIHDSSTQIPLSLLIVIAPILGIQHIYHGAQLQKSFLRLQIWYFLLLIDLLIFSSLFLQKSYWSVTLFFGILPTLYSLTFYAFYRFARLNIPPALVSLGLIMTVCLAGLTLLLAWLEFTDSGTFVRHTIIGIITDWKWVLGLFIIGYALLKYFANFIVGFIRLILSISWAIVKKVLNIATKITRKAASKVNQAAITGTGYGLVSIWRIFYLAETERQLQWQMDGNTLSRYPTSKVYMALGGCIFSAIILWYFGDIANSNEMLAQAYKNIMR